MSVIAESHRDGLPKWDQTTIIGRRSTRCQCEAFQGIAGVTALHAEIMAIGDELTSGQRLDTNSQWLSQRLGEIGIPVRFHSTVGDHQEVLVDALRIAARRSPLVILTGGLGPTADDLTRQAMAAAVGCDLVLEQAALASIHEKFARSGREMPPQNEIQAMFPVGSHIIANPHGTAPGIDLTWAYDGSSSRCFALPGVPAEMKEMWWETVEPAIRPLSPRQSVIRHRLIKCFGIGESHLESMLPDLIRRDREPRVGITVHRATITLRITAEGSNEDDCLARMEPTVETIHRCLGNLVFGEGDDELEHVVMGMLGAREASLSVCEWGTGGVVARWLSDADERGQFRSGLVLPSRQAITSVLGSNAPRDETASLVNWMAVTLRERSGSDYALAVGPLPRDVENERVHIALAGPNFVCQTDHGYGGHPDIRLERAAKQALDFARQELGSRGDPA